MNYIVELLDRCIVESERFACCPSKVQQFSGETI